MNGQATSQFRVEHAAWIKALREVTHPAHRRPAKGWSRADAVALLAATAAVLA